MSTQIKIAVGLAQDGIYTTYNNYINDDDGHCSCDEQEKCQTPGAHPIDRMGTPMEPIDDKDEIYEWGKLYNEAFDIAIYQKLSRIRIFKRAKDTEVACLANTEQTLECIDKDGNHYLFYKCDSNISIVEEIVEVDGCSIDIVSSDPFIITPYFKWKNLSSDNGLQELPADIHNAIVFSNKQEEVSSPDTIPSTFSDLIVPETKAISVFNSGPSIDVKGFNNSKSINTNSSRQQLIIDIRKPKNLEHIMIRGGEEWMIEAPLITTGQNNCFLVDWKVYNKQPNECQVKNLYVAINDKNIIFVWPIKKPYDNGDLDSWNKSAQVIASHAKEQWVGISSNRDLGAYDIEPLGNTYGNPKWPDYRLDQIIGIAFMDKYITSLDHPIMKSIRGER